MKQVEALQATAGQLAFEIPFTDVHVGSPQYLAFSAAVGGAAFYGARILRRDTQKMDTDTRSLIVGSAGESVKKARRRGMVSDLMLGGLAAASTMSFLADKSDLYRTKADYIVDNVAIVADASRLSFAEDVEDDGEQKARIQVTVDGLNELDDLTEIDLTFIAAGRNPRTVARITEDNQDRNNVVTGFEQYIADEANIGTAENGYPDMETALDLAFATQPDKTIIIGELEGIDGGYFRHTEVIDGEPTTVFESEEGERNISAISLGSAGLVQVQGEVMQSNVNPAYSAEVVGEEDTYAPKTQDDFVDIIREIKDKELRRTTKEDIDWFSRLTPALFAATGLYALGRFLNQTYIKRLRK